MDREAKVVRSVRTAVRTFLAEQVELDARSRVLVGVSGGPDSVCLLHAAASLNGSMCAELHAVHVNHRLRGEEADVDEEYVRDLCDMLGLELSVDRVDVAALAEEKQISFEEAGREARYGFFARVAKEINAGVVLVGHTADDQVETVLFQLIRGAGLGGLSGMRPVSTWQSPACNVLVGRPLLHSTRVDTEAYCESVGLDPRTDSSNESRDFSRNRIRHEVLPLLRQISSGSDMSVLRLASIAAQSDDFVAAHARAWLEENATFEASKVVLDRHELSGQPDVLKTYIIREALRSFNPHLQGISERHLKSLVRLTEGRSGRMICLPWGVMAHVDTNLLELRRERASSAVSISEHLITLPGVALVGPWRVEGRLVSSTDPFPDGRCTAHLDARSVGTVIVRTRRAGDRFQPLGMGEPKKLQDFFVDAKVGRSERDRVPLVVVGQDIVWVVGHRVGELAKVHQGAREVLRIEFKSRDAESDLAATSGGRC